MPKVFISYARLDKDLAHRVYDDLCAMNGVEPWLDIYSLLPGIKYKPAIRKAIREADYFLALISSNSATGRGFRNTELDQALKILTEFPDSSVFLIPVRLDECEMPRDDLSELNHVDLFPDWTGGITKLKSVFAPEKSPARKDLVKPRSEAPDSRYHYRVGLVDLDLGLVNLRTIAEGLNGSQRFFHFTCPQMPSLTSAVQEIEGFPHLAVHRIPPSFIAEHRYLAVDLVTCLTKYPLAFIEDGQLLWNYFAGESSDDERFLFVSANQLYSHCRTAGRSFEEGLVHLILGQLTEYFTKIGYHYETRSCVMDHCMLRSDQIRGLKARRFCDECDEAMPQGDLKNALQALLDWRY
jgi:hypothetical protein